MAGAPAPKAGGGLAATLKRKGPGGVPVGVYAGVGVIGLAYVIKRHQAGKAAGNTTGASQGTPIDATGAPTGDPGYGPPSFGGGGYPGVGDLGGVPINNVPLRDGLDPNGPAEPVDNQAAQPGAGLTTPPGGSRIGVPVHHQAKPATTHTTQATRHKPKPPKPLPSLGTTAKPRPLGKITSPTGERTLNRYKAGQKAKPVQRKR